MTAVSDFGAVNQKKLKELILDAANAVYLLELDLTVFAKEESAVHLKNFFNIQQKRLVNPVEEQKDQKEEALQLFETDSKL